MTASTPSTPLEWDQCAHDTDGQAVLCRGERVPGNDRCLAHLTDQQRRSYLATLRPGSSVSHRGTAITSDLLVELTAALRDQRRGILFGRTRFDHATFEGDALFGGAAFDGDAWFGWATFEGDAWFVGAQFGRDAWFSRATFHGEGKFGHARIGRTAGFGGAMFHGDAWFGEAKIGKDARFIETTFDSNARFGKATFGKDAWFSRATFHGDARFGETAFDGNVRFDGATFDGHAQWGPLVCQDTVDLRQATFARPITLEVAAARLDCTRTTWSTTVTMRVRHARIDLTDAQLTAPLEVTGRPTSFVDPSSTAWGGAKVELSQGALGNTDDSVRVVSVRGVDATYLVLNNVNLGECLFTGTFHLDRLTLGGQITFAQPPAGWLRHGWLPARWSRRRTVAEEHHWRHRDERDGWAPPPDDLDGAGPEPDGLATIYRSLRKALEDRGDAPGAADFYYGEMDMRRHDTTTTRAEHGLLTAYWLLAGYGLRASRALISLVLIMTVTVLAIMLFGLPATTPEPVTTGTPQSDGRIVLHTTTPPAVLPPLAQRLNGDRAGTAIPVVLNAVIFRAADATLTPTGVYLDMAARLAEPSLLALAVLGLRGRVKR
jgi:hypothetical protein